MLGRFLTHNPGLKLGALAVSLLLWFHIATEKDGYQRFLDVPLVIEGIRPDYVIAEEVPTTVRVIFQGKGKPLLSLDWRDVSVIVDASDIQTRGTRSIRLENVRYPESTDLVAVQIIEPELITIEIDRLVTMALPIRPMLMVDEAPGHTVVGAATVEPESVFVSGPESQVRQLQAIATDTLEFRRARRPVDQEIGLQAPDLFNTSLEQTTVRVRMDVQQIGERSFPEIPVVLERTPPSGRYLAQPRTAQVTVSGGVKVLEALLADQIRVVLDLENRPPDALVPLDPTIQLPPGVTLVRLEPPRFRVTEY